MFFKTFHKIIILALFFSVMIGCCYFFLFYFSNRYFIFCNIPKELTSGNLRVHCKSCTKNERREHSERYNRNVEHNPTVFREKNRDTVQIKLSDNFSAKSAIGRSIDPKFKGEGLIFV